jgi:hypothetical protein
MKPSKEPRLVDRFLTAFASKIVTLGQARSATISVYTGPPPERMSDAPTGDLLVCLYCVEGRTTQFEGLPIASGRAGYFRIVGGPLADNADEVMLQGVFEPDNRYLNIAEAVRLRCEIRLQVNSDGAASFDLEF